MLGHKLLRRSPVEYWTPEILEEVIKNDPLNENDLYEIVNSGHYVKVREYDYKDRGICCLWFDPIIIPRMNNPIEEIKSLIHELLHLTFPYRSKVHPDYLSYEGIFWKCGALTGEAYEKFEFIIETEAQRIYREDPELTLKIQELFNFPKGEVYPNPRQLRLF